MPTPTRPLLLISLMITLSACGEPKPEPAAAPQPPQPVAAAPTAAPTAPARPIAAPQPPPTAAKDKALSHFDATAAKDQAQKFRDHLAAGRKAVKAKKLPEGIKSLEAALAIDPNHASALAELGWALYLSGDLAKAERITRQAIAAATLERTRGAALYNLGRIHEDRGEKDEAALAYQRSLALRPNDTVSARLTALESAGAAPTAHECDVVAHNTRPPFDLCAALIAKLPADPDYTENRCLEHETTTTEVAVDAAGTKYGGETATLIALDLGGGIQATTFGVERWLESGGASTERHLAVLFDEKWFTLALGGEYNPGVGYIGESFWVESMTAEDLVAGGRPELLLKIKWQHSDGDYGDNATEDTERTIIAVVGLDGDAPRWLGAFVNSVVDSTGPMLDDEPSDAPVTRREKAVDFRWLAASGELEIFARAGVEPSATPGRFALGSLPAACPTTLPYIN